MPPLHLVFDAALPSAGAALGEADIAGRHTKSELSPIWRGGMPLVLSEGSRVTFDALVKGLTAYVGRRFE